MKYFISLLVIAALILIRVAIGFTQITPQAVPSALAQKAAAYDLYRQEARESTDALLDTITIQNERRNVRQFRDRHGFLKYFGAPPGAPAQLDPRFNGASPEERAFGFLEQFGAAFGIYSPNTGFSTVRVTNERSGHFVRLQQWYGDIPVFAGQMVVQLDDGIGVKAVVSELMTNTYDQDLGVLSTAPTLRAEDAEIFAISDMVSLTVEEFERGDIERPLDEEDLVVSGTPELHVFDPVIVGGSGDPKLVWRISVRDNSYLLLQREVLIDAHSGYILHQNSGIANAMKVDIIESDWSGSSTNDEQWCQTPECSEEHCKPDDCTIFETQWNPSSPPDPDTSPDPQTDRDFKGLTVNIRQTYDYFAANHTLNGSNYRGMTGADETIYVVGHYNGAFYLSS